MKPAKNSSHGETLSIGPPLQVFESEPIRKRGAKRPRVMRAREAGVSGDPVRQLKQVAAQLAPADRIRLAELLLHDLPPHELARLVEQLNKRRRNS